MLVAAGAARIDVAPDILVVHRLGVLLVGRSAESDVAGDLAPYRGQEMRNMVEDRPIRLRDRSCGSGGRYSGQGQHQDEGDGDSERVAHGDSSEGRSAAVSMTSGAALQKKTNRA